MFQLMMMSATLLDVNIFAVMVRREQKPHRISLVSLLSL